MGSTCLTRSLLRVHVDAVAIYCSSTRRASCEIAAIMKYDESDYDGTH